MKIWYISEIPIKFINTPLENLPPCGKLINYISFNCALHLIAKNLPPLSHTLLIIPNIMLLLDISNKFWSSMRDIHTTPIP